MDEVKKIDNQIIIRKAMIDAISDGHTIGEIRSIAEKMNVSMWQVFNACLIGGVPVYTRADGKILCDFTALVDVLKSQATELNEERIERR